MQVTFVGKDEGWAPVPVEHFRGLIFFKGKINGTDANILLDNGSPTTIDAAFARRLGLATLRELTKGNTGSAQMARHLVQNGQIEVPHQATLSGPLQTLDFQPLAKLTGHPIDAMLGGDVLKVMALVLVADNLYLVPSGSVHFQGNPANLPLVEGDRIAVQIDGKPVTLALDLGSNGTVSLSARGWQKVMPGDVKIESSQQSNAEGVARTIQRSPGHVLQIGPIRVDGVTVPNVGASPDAVDGLLGAAFLSHFQMILDIPAKNLSLAPASPAAAPAAQKQP
jgi:predicted aspartyl protease